MPNKRYLVTLTPDERETLQRLPPQGLVRARKMKRAHIPLKADQSATDPEIMAALDVSRPCVERLRQRFVEVGLNRALYDAPRPCALAELTGSQQARLIAEARSNPPEELTRWTWALLADRAVPLMPTERLSYETVRRVS